MILRDEILTDREAQLLCAHDLLHSLIANRNRKEDDLHAPWGGLFSINKQRSINVILETAEC